MNNLIMMKKKLDNQVDEEINKIVQEYNKKQIPLIEKINQIIAGERSPERDEIQEAALYLSKQEIDSAQQYINSKPIPEYWFKVLTNCTRLSHEIFPSDYPLLKCITKIEHIPEEDTNDFTITFHLAPNNYIYNQTLSVRFEMMNEHDPARIECTPINWKEGNNLFLQTVTKKQSNKKTGVTRTVTKTVEGETFFNFFRSIDPKVLSQNEDEDEITEKLHLAYDIAVVISEEIIPYHLEYFLGLREEDDIEGQYDETINDESEVLESSYDPKAIKKNKVPANNPKPNEKSECHQQ